ncbi:hypothetical protein BWQ96_08436 [Gracilariopsis chorda]|uniref:Uncharacterized protein n=1 Tax=Gracilariopsis chorda TaxID=448386 RepID=A0A2V3IIC8_9FLOR|nr:hypothetical protein BWQ96_08436 [Gracilariopsis chorda]|eukprot:PXF41837.1 hypothetical protein BWQ96_08436 [Gracilariopsis chorda]
MHGYHLIEYFPQSTEARRQWYVQQPRWWNEYEAPQWVLVPTPLVLAYFGRLTREGSPCYHTIWSVAMCKWAVLVSMLALEAGRHDITWNLPCPETAFYSHEFQPVGRLYRLPMQLIQLIRCLGISDIVARTGYTENHLDNYLRAAENHRWGPDQVCEVWDHDRQRVSSPGDQALPGDDHMGEEAQYGCVVETPEDLTYTASMAPTSGQHPPVPPSNTTPVPRRGRFQPIGLVSNPIGGGEHVTAPEVTDTLMRIQQLCVTRLKRPGLRSIQEALTILEALITRHATYVETLNQVGGFRTNFQAELYRAVTHHVGELSDLLRGASSTGDPLMGTLEGPLLASGVWYRVGNVLMPAPSTSAPGPSATVPPTYPGAPPTTPGSNHNGSRRAGLASNWGHGSTGAPSSSSHPSGTTAGPAGGPNVTPMMEDFP